MRRVFFNDDMESTPFQEGARRNSIKLPDVEFVDSPEGADTICARNLVRLVPYLHSGQSLYIWTHEPSWCGVDTKSIQDAATGKTIHISSAFNGDIYISPLYYFPFAKISREALFSTLGNRGRFCVMMATYGLKPNRFVGGVHVDITSYRQGMAIYLNQTYGACDIFGRNWPKSVTVMEESRGVGWEARKMAALSDYRFNIACENTVTKNYVTEKIWQAIESGAVPIYLGRGTGIEEVLSATSYVDPGQFSNFGALHDHISGMSLTDRTAIVDSALTDYEQIAKTLVCGEVKAMIVERFARRVHEIC